MEISVDVIYHGSIFCVHCSSLGIKFVCCSVKKSLLLISIILEIQNPMLSCNDELLLFNLMHKFFFSCVYSLNNGLDYIHTIQHL
jgi:hypothetical protein